MLEIKSRVFFSTVSAILALVAVNPVALGSLPKYPLVLMVSHYSLYASGVILGYFTFRGNLWKPLAYLGLVPPILFHLPTLFVDSVLYLQWTFVDYVTMMLGGFLLGVGLKTMRLAEKVSIFVLYMIGDTLLAVLLVLGFPVYSPPVVPFSPFTVSQFYAVAYVMFTIMNLILFIVIGYVFKRLLS